MYQFMCNGTVCHLALLLQNATAIYFNDILRNKSRQTGIGDNSMLINTEGYFNIVVYGKMKYILPISWK